MTFSAVSAVILYAMSAGLLLYIAWSEFTFWRPWRAETRELDRRIAAHNEQLRQARKTLLNDGPGRISGEERSDG